MAEKPIHAKPQLYSLIFYGLKEIALKYGYNLVLHGSINRDLDLIAIPWVKEADAAKIDIMINEFRDYTGGSFNTGHGDYLAPWRRSYVINLNRGGYQKDDSYVQDPQWYIDISVIVPMPVT